MVCPCLRLKKKTSDDKSDNLVIIVAVLHFMYHFLVKQMSHKRFSFHYSIKNHCVIFEWSKLNSVTGQGGLNLPCNEVFEDQKEDP